MERNRARIRHLALSLHVVLLGALPQIAQADQLIVLDGQSHTASGVYDTGTAGGNGGIALAAQGTGSAIVGQNVSAITGGINATGVYANLSGSINLTDSMVQTSGISAYGVLAQEKGVVDLTNTRISTSGGLGAIGVAALNRDTNGGVVNLHGGEVSTKVGTAIVASGVGSRVSTNSTIITAEAGDGIYGVAAQSGGLVELRGGSVSVNLPSVNSGIGGYALYVGDKGSALHASGTNVSSNGSYAAYVGKGGAMTLDQGTKVTTTAYGVRADGVGSSIIVDDSSISAGTVAKIGAITPVGVSALDGGEVKLLNGTTVQSSIGAYISGGRVVAENSHILTSTTQADANVLSDVGVVISGGGSLQLTSSTVQAKREAISVQAPSSALGGGPNTITVTGGEVSSGKAAAVSVASNGLIGASADLYLKDGALLKGANNQIISVTSIGGGDARLNTVADNVTLGGNMTAYGSNAVLNLSLLHGSSWTGSVLGGNAFSVDSTSQWTLSSNSIVNTLRSEGAIGFAAPNASAYKVLHVKGDYTGTNASIALNTVLNSGGTLANQFTDRVLIEGNANGSTALKVVGTGSGAATSSKNGPASSNEGISLVQVAGQSSVSTFVLSGGYVAVGPWRYELAAYRPGESSESQRLVAGSGNGYWDYRLQSTLVPDPKPTPTPTPTPTPNPAPTPSPSPSPAPDPNDNGGSTPVRPGVVPQVPAYLSASTALLSYGMRSLGTLHDRLGELHQGDAGQAGSTDEFYARTFGGNYQYRTDRSFSQYGYDFDQNDRGLQIGSTWLKTVGDASSFRLGAYVSTGTSRATPKAIDGSSAMRMSANSVAATGTYMTGNGFYLDGVVARNYYSTRVDTAYRGHDMASMKTHGWSYSLESGYPFVFGNDVRLEPQAQVVYQQLSTNSFHDADGLTVSPDNTGAWQGRVGANLGKTFVTAGGQRWTPWMRVNYLWSSSSRSAVDISSDAWGVSSSLASGSWGQAWQVGAGVTGALTSTLSVYGSGDYQGNVGSAGEQGWSANLGIRWQF